MDTTEPAYIVATVFLLYIIYNCIYNKILDRDWFSARLFVTKSAYDHVGAQLQASNLFRVSITYAFVVSLRKALQTFTL